MRFRTRLGAGPYFTDRVDAGNRLAAELHGFRGRDDVTVLGLARGGVPIASRVAADLRLPSGALVVRKLGVPGRPEVAFGALATHGPHRETLYVTDTVDALLRHGYTQESLDEVEGAELAELAGRVARYGASAQRPVAGRTVLLCDDGIATGATMRAAVRLMRKAGAAVVLVCVPTAPADTARALTQEADDVVCLRPLHDLEAVSQVYLHFDQVSDVEVLDLLRRSPGDAA
ncbi:phosphoribosyltransferase [Specibacter cremeus]|uniref:phosphoribosyltransferase n=1 Tax=Specibacter cremeus TaxID=1629051 RepID=UPI000F797B13|nr:phosphoribosyltransferase family protein [Specibacter cremeus]